MRPYMTTAEFWLATLERAIKTAAQTAVALIGTGAIGILDVDWRQVASVSALAAIVSVLTSLASDRIGNPGPSLVGEGTVPPPLPEPHTAVQAETVTPAAPDIPAPDLRAVVDTRNTGYRLPDNPEDVLS